MSMEYIRADESCPFSDVVVVDGKWLFLSGLISEDLDSGEVLAGDIAYETRQTLLNMKQILEANGSDMAHVVRCEVLLHDFAERNEMNEEYAKHFPADAMPARLCYGGVDLAADCKIEIIAIARKKDV